MFYRILSLLHIFAQTRPILRELLTVNTVTYEMIGCSVFCFDVFWLVLLHFMISVMTVSGILSAKC